MLTQFYNNLIFLQYFIFIFIFHIHSYLNFRCTCLTKYRIWLLNQYFILIGESRNVTQRRILTLFWFLFRCIFVLHHLYQLKGNHLHNLHHHMLTLHLTFQNHPTRPTIEIALSHSLHWQLPGSNTEKMLASHDDNKQVQTQYVGCPLLTIPTSVWAPN